jgi:hypothetical protein
MSERHPRGAVGSVLVLAACLSPAILYGQVAASPGSQAAPSSAAAGGQSGPYYALVIGNDNYRYLRKLQTPINDANSMAQLLHDTFGFDTKVLLDADRNQIITALINYRATLPKNSNLLIYYAGHGYHDRDTDEAYWLPIDAQPNNNANWVSADDVTRDVRAMDAMHVLVISDSCYSGYMTRGGDFSIKPTERSAYLAKMMESKSRDLMSSGGDEPVADAGAPGHSVFAWAVLESLREMPENSFTAADVFERYIQPRVGGKSDQMPQYSWIRNSGHEAGDFVFFRHSTADAGTATIASATPVASTPSVVTVANATPVVSTPNPAPTTSAPSSPAPPLPSSNAPPPSSPVTARSGGEPIASPASTLPNMNAELTSVYQKAQAGDPNAMQDLALAYHFGRGVPKSDDQAAIWYRKAAEAGNGRAQNDLGVCYENGWGVPIDFGQAVAWYHKAADAGLALGMVNLGLMYERGRGVPQDYHQEVVWFRRAAERDNPRGMWGLGRAYKYGYGVNKDYQIAVAWFGKSAEAGDPQGMCGLGTMYENGWGVQRNLQQSIALYNKAAEMGNECAREQLKRRAENPSSAAP